MARLSGHGYEGRRLALALRAQLAEDIRRARANAGLSQRSAASAVGMSPAQFGRIERGELPHLSIDQASRAAVAVGMRIALRAYPDGDPVVDHAQRALLDRFRKLMPGDLRWRTEVPLPIQGDRRAWDAVVTVAGSEVAIEAETRLRDLQALERRLALKQRDGLATRVVLVVADTRANRRALALHRDSLRARLPADRAEILAALRSRRAPPRDGLVLL